MRPDPADDERPGHRQLVRRVAVGPREVDREGLVNRIEPDGYVEHQAVLPRNRVAGVGEDSECQIFLLGRGKALVRRLWRDGDETGAERMDLRQHSLVGTQRLIAVRAPRATVEREHDRAARELSVQRHLPGSCVGKNERRRRYPN